MGVKDLWHLKKKPKEKTARRSKRYGRGRRWRVSWEDPHTGETETLRTLLASFVDEGHDVMSLMRSIVLSRGFREASEPVIEETP